MQHISKKPLVSVILPIYNSEQYLSVAIDSILTQSYINFELILIDDASNDGSLKIAQSFKKRFPKKITLISLNKNRNCGGDRCANEGLKIAKGEFIARMDADDIAHKDRLQIQVEYLLSHPKTFLVGSNAYVIDQSGKIIGEKSVPTSSKDIYKMYSIFHPLIHPSCMFRKIVNGRQFRYDIKYSANNDYNTFFGLLCSGQKFVNLPSKLLYYRIHGQNDTLVNVKKKYINTLKIRIDMVRRHGYKPTFKAILSTIVQSVILLTLPESLLINLYLITKGIRRLTLPILFNRPALFLKDSK